MTATITEMSMRNYASIILDNKSRDEGVVDRPLVLDEQDSWVAGGS